MTKRLVIFGDALTYPPIEGISSHVFSLIRSLQGTNISPVLLVADRGFMSDQDYRDIGSEVHVVNPDIFYDYAKVSKIIDSLKPDIIQSYNVYQARLISCRYSIERHVPLVMEHHDLESDLADFLDVPPSVAEENIRAQHQVANIANCNRVMSSEDYRSILPHIAGDWKATMVNIPVGHNDEFKNASFNRKNKHDVLFVGNGAYPPNEEAIRFIVDHLALKLPHINFHLVGRRTQDLSISSPKNVIAYGAVDNLIGIVERCGVGIAPISNGSGMKIKLLTYLSGGLVVVATPLAKMGFEQTKYITGSDMYNFDKTLQMVVTSIQHTDYEGARTQFLKLYEANTIASKLVEIYENLQFIPTERAKYLYQIESDESRLAWIHELRESEYSITNDHKKFKAVKC